MKRIGITQRVSSAINGQPHDCLDQAWSDLLTVQGYFPVALPNLADAASVAPDYLSALDLDGVILSGGNDIGGLAEGLGSEVSTRRDAFERTVIGWARQRAVPLLGVCRGMQFINVVLGGRLTAVEGHVAMRHSVTPTLARSSCFSGLNSGFEVNSFHNYAIQPSLLAPGLHISFSDDEGNVEAFAHDAEHIAGIMWHPEREMPPTDVDREIMRRFFG